MNSYDNMPEYIPDPKSYEDRVLSINEIKGIKFDIIFEKRANSAIDLLFHHFQHERQFRPQNYNQEQMRIALSNTFFWLVRGGESGLGAVNIVHMVLVSEIDNSKDSESSVIYGDLLREFYYMYQRWIDALLSGGEPDVS